MQLKAYRTYSHAFLEGTHWNAQQTTGFIITTLIIYVMQNCIEIQHKENYVGNTH